MPGTQNFKRPVNLYEKKFLGALPKLFEKKSAFGVFAHSLQVDAIDNNDEAFMVKVKSNKITLGNYNNQASIYEESGRMPKAQEQSYRNVSVPFTYHKAINAMIDRSTVNNDLGRATAENAAEFGELYMEFYDAEIAKELVAKADKTIKVALTKDAVKAAIEEARVTLANNRITKKGRHIVCTPEFLGIVAELDTTITGKNAQVDMTSAEMVEKNKGFTFHEAPVEDFPKGVFAIASVEKVTNPFTGLTFLRTIESETFDGKLFQQGAKGGIFTPDDNAKAIVVIKTDAPIV